MLWDSSVCLFKTVKLSKNWVQCETRIFFFVELADVKGNSAVFPHVIPLLESQQQGYVIGKVSIYYRMES